MEVNGPIPLEKRTIRVKFNGVHEEVPAIHRTWISQRAFPRYLRPPFRENGSLPLGAKEMWLELITLLKEDLQWLLSQPHHVFWSQILETKVPITTLTSFLQDAPPSYTQQTLPESEMDVALKETARLVFLVYCRLSTVRESPEHFLTEKAFGDIIYDNYIFTIPSLLDLCAVYGQSNSEVVKKILDNVTKAQPKYLGDLGMAHRHLVQLLERAKGMLGDGKWSGKAKNVRDVIVHVYDSLTTLRIFLEMFPKGCYIFASTEFVSSIATFYSSVIPDLVKCDEYMEIVQNIRGECIRIVRKVFEDLLEKELESRDDELVELHLALISEIMSEGPFVMDYHAVHPLDIDMDVIGSVCPDLDNLKIDYLLEALSSHLGASPLPKKAPEKAAVGNIVNYPHTSANIAAAAAAASNLPSVSGVELESLITQVQDLLPHLGSSFVEACLRHYDFSSEKVVAAILESSLPPSLEELQWEKQKAPVATTSVADEGSFDVGYRGKRPKEHRNLNQLLNDKRELNEMKDRFSSMRFVEDTSYDDEYDDTYESEDVAVREAGDDRLRRPFVTPRVLEQGRRPKIEEENDDDDEEEEEVKKDHFVANPEELRAKAEQRRADQRARRDVVGKPKGQGQDKQVLINRAKKQVHKSSAGNHNRRDQAHRKRNQGMIPS